MVNNPGDSSQSQETWQVWVEEPIQSQHMRNYENCDWFVVLLIPGTCDFENVVFISSTYILVVHGELEETLTPLLLILQPHFHLWYLIFTRPQAPLRLIVYKKPAFSEEQLEKFLVDVALSL